MIIQKKCKLCGETIEIRAKKQDYEAFLNGAHPQDALPYLTADEREILISGICGICFDEMFEEDSKSGTNGFHFREDDE